MVRSSTYRAPFGPGGESPIDAAVCERLLSIALSRGGQYADLFFEYRATSGLVYDENVLKGASRSVELGLGVRVQRGEATGFASTQDLSWEAMRRAAETAAAITSGTGGHARIELSPRALEQRYDTLGVSIDAPSADKTRLLEEATAAAHAYDPSILKANIIYSEEIREILLATSDGVLVFDTQPLFLFGVQVIAHKDGKLQQGISAGGGRRTLAYFDERAPAAHGREAARQAVVMLDAREAPAGELAVVLAPGDSGILLHEAVGHGLEADFNRKGTSNYSGQVGRKVASDLCTVVDDATLVRARGSINVDDEGNPPGRRVLIEGGTLAGYLHDRHSSKHYGTESTGNGRRESYETIPLPRMTNTILLAGPHDPEEIMGSVKRGIFAKKFGGGEVDIGNGDFVFSLTESYLIEDGKITAPLKGVNLIGNGPEVLRHVTMLGTDLEVSDGSWVCRKNGQSLPVGVGCPTVKIDKITIGGTRLS